MSNRNQVVYTDDLGLIDSSDYGVQSQHTVVVGPNVSESDYKTDGTADDVQINKAVLDVNAAGGGTVILQAGTYNMAGDITLRDFVHLKGQGESTKIVIPANRRIFIDEAEKCSISFLRIDALSQNVNNFAIYVANTQDVLVDNIWGEYKAFGVFIAAGSVNTRRIKVSNSFFYGLANNDLIGGGPFTTGSFEVFDIICENNFLEHDLTQPGSGTYRNVFDIVAVKYLTFKDNHVRGNLEFGSEQNPNQFSKMIGNVVRPAIGETSCGIQVNATNPSLFSGENIIISDNIVQSGTIRIAGVAAFNLNGVNITNNTITAGSLFGQSLGISVSNSTKVIISNNNVTGFTFAGISIADSSHLLINGNLFSDATGIGIRDASIPLIATLTATSNVFKSVTTALQISSSAYTASNRSTTQTLQSINNVFATATIDNIVTTKTDGTTTALFNRSGSVPNQVFNILPDYTKQVGATSSDVFFAFNGEVSKYSFYSKWSGVNKNLFEINGINDTNISYNPFVVNTIQERTTDAGVTIDGVLIKDSLDASGIVNKTTAQSIAGVKTFTNNLRFSSLSMVGTDGNYLSLVSGAGASSPNQDINFLADYVKQVSATSVSENHGFNGEISNYRWYSKWNGSNVQLLNISFPDTTIYITSADLNINTAGKGLRVREGSNAKMGVATLVAGTVTVANTSVTANSRIFLTSQSDGGTPGFLRVSTRVNGSSFTITSSSNTDTSVVAYQIIEPA